MDQPQPLNDPILLDAIRNVPSEKGPYFDDFHAAQHIDRSNIMAIRKNDADRSNSSNPQHIVSSTGTDGRGRRKRGRCGGDTSGSFSGTYDGPSEAKRYTQKECWFMI